jgi:protein-L-isoaspartate(D-aspartate) O-methyltransferase
MGAFDGSLLPGLAACVVLAACSPPTPPSPMGSPDASDDDARAAEREALVDSFVGQPGSLVTDARVVEAMRATPRHRFVPQERQSEAYRDHPLPIGHGQTISQPSLVAYMTQVLEPGPGDRVLEIGTGSGYQAAVLSPLVAEVFTIEIVEPLAARAAAALAELGYENVKVRAGDGHLGWPEAAPFDAIIVTCAPDAVPPALVEQLREGGRMVVPVGPQNAVQELYLLEKREGKVERRAILPVRFVPMTGGATG